MKRRILVGMLGLVLAGCAQTRPAMPLSKTGSRLPPVGLTPVPNIYEAINRENPRLNPLSLRPENGPVLAQLDAGPNGGPGHTHGPAGPGPTPNCGCAPGSDTPAPAMAPHLRQALAIQAAGPPPGITGPARAQPAPPTEYAAGPELMPISGSNPASGLADRAAPAPAAAEPTPREILQTSSEPMPQLPPAEPAPPAAELAPAPLLPATPDELPTLPAGFDEVSTPAQTLPPAPELKPEPAPAPAPLPEPASIPGEAATYRSDPEVVTVATDPATLRADGPAVQLREVGGVAAHVGNEVITMHELSSAVKEKVANLPNGYKPTKQEIMAITSQVLDMLIERSTIIQEARREMKDPKRINMFMDIASKVWQEEELPPLLRTMSVTNEYELKQKLAEKGKSLETMRESFKLDFLAKGYLEQKLKPRITIDVPEMRDYYNAHLADFDRPAQWTWREVLIEVEKHASRAEARQKAEAVLARLRGGEDFATVARADSEGPNKSSGGLWETAPDSYYDPAVNEALRSLPIGQVSPIIEGPSGFHIARLESRRPAGPATFPEVQDKIRNFVHRQKVRTESEGYLAKLRKQTVVSTIFDRSEYAPAATRQQEAATASNP